MLIKVHFPEPLPDDKELSPDLPRQGGFCDRLRRQSLTFASGQNTATACKYRGRERFTQWVEGKTQPPYTKGAEHNGASNPSNCTSLKLQLRLPGTSLNIQPRPQVDLAVESAVQVPWNLAVFVEALNRLSAPFCRRQGAFQKPA